MGILWAQKNPIKSGFKQFQLAPLAGLEPATKRLTVFCSTN